MIRRHIFGTSFPACFLPKNWMYIQYILRFSQSQTKKSVPNLYHLIKSVFPYFYGSVFRPRDGETGHHAPGIMPRAACPGQHAPGTLSRARLYLFPCRSQLACAGTVWRRQQGCKGLRPRGLRLRGRSPFSCTVTMQQLQFT